MKKTFRNIGIGTTVYLFILVIETLYELFQISGTKQVITFLGASIDNKETKHNIATTFGLTPRIAITYVIFIAFFALITTFVKKKRTKNND